ncbi:MAG: hypothetical protein P9M04_00310 [Candidatus Orphnella occulta]|nr:hypothetical protein [Candidatus Orphnella occulta]
MSIQHKDLAQGRWQKMPFLEQMSNIGSEIQRAVNWKKKNNIEYSNKASVRALELIDITLDNLSGFARLKEICRLREAVVDYFFYSNQFKSTDGSWERYFLSFTYAARKHT